MQIAAIGPDITLYDPSDNPGEVKNEYGILTVTQFQVHDGFGANILAMAHKEFQISVCMLIRTAEPKFSMLKSFWINLNLWAALRFKPSRTQQTVGIPSLQNQN